MDASLELHADQAEKPRHFEVKLLGPGMVLKKNGSENWACIQQIRGWGYDDVMRFITNKMIIWVCMKMGYMIYPNSFFLGFLRENDDH